LIQNVMAGGDSAARGMAVGMLLGAHLGEAAIPASWLAELEPREEIVELLGELT
jgi:ADP-ribosylglycohydrolase